jgi:hypothetical protein
MPEWSRNHLENLDQILESLQWLIQPDTVLTELPFDLEFLSRPDVERLVEWSRKSVSKEELAAGKFTLNKPMIRFFMQKTFPDLPPDMQKEKIDFLDRELHNLLKLNAFETVALNTENLDKLVDILNNIEGESHFDKTKKRIKIAISLKWLQDKELMAILSPGTRQYVERIGMFYGRIKKGENVSVRDIGTYHTPPDDIKKIIDDYELKVDFALLGARQDINKAKQKFLNDPRFGPLGFIMEAVNRLSAYIDEQADEDYDRTELFKDTIFIAIILNYVQDPYVKKSPEANKLIQMVLPIYSKYKELETL